MSKKKSDGECLAAKRTFVGRSPRPCERAEQAEPERFLFSDRKDDAGVFKGCSLRRGGAGSHGSSAGSGTLAGAASRGKLPPFRPLAAV